jgi:hypothetical protein
MYRQNEKYKELAQILQSEILDDYDIYEGPLSERGDINGNNINEPCWHFNSPAGDRGPIYDIEIFPKNRLTQEGKETLQKILKDIELKKYSIESHLDLEFEIEIHDTFLVISIPEYNIED